MNWLEHHFFEHRTNPKMFIYFWLRTIKHQTPNIVQPITTFVLEHQNHWYRFKNICMPCVLANHVQMNGKPRFCVVYFLWSIFLLFLVRLSNVMIYVYFSELSSKMWKMIFHLCSKRIISHVEADRGRKFQQTWFYEGLPTSSFYWT